MLLLCSAGKVVAQYSSLILLASWIHQFTIIINSLSDDVITIAKKILQQFLG